MFAEDGVVLEFALNAIQLLLELLIASHHEVLQNVAGIGDGLQHRQDGRVDRHTFSQLGPSQRRQAAQHHVVGQLLLCKDALQLGQAFQVHDLHP